MSLPSRWRLPQRPAWLIRRPFPSFVRTVTEPGTRNRQIHGPLSARPKLSPATLAHPPQANAKALAFLATTHRTASRIHSFQSFLNQLIRHTPLALLASSAHFSTRARRGSRPQSTGRSTDSRDRICLGLDFDWRAPHVLRCAGARGGREGTTLRPSNPDSCEGHIIHRANACAASLGSYTETPVTDLSTRAHLPSNRRRWPFCEGAGACHAVVD
ncbi:hypothetical protein B0T24DRAFT_279279 [Lasiosphaeria ovina]|uniref:Uncharacterized protein n=1 Tax=Lasiosphaeria ovina TaxID=92902 RepID=A0AAE0N7Q1_9PEZI|nr:hypothetical protein B0T24DRAFT_279279 [Lasiosphaeria ovina]